MLRIGLLAVLFAVLLAGCERMRDRELVQASGAGDLAAIQKLISTGAEPNVRALDGWTPLTVAAREGHVEIVEYLVEHGAQIDMTEDGGNSPLFWAAYNGHIEVVRWLLQHGAVNRAGCERCKSPHEAATSRKHDEVASLLTPS